MQIKFLSAVASEESIGKIFDELLDAEETDVLARVISVAKHISDAGGVPSPPYAKPLRGIGEDGLCEICVKYTEGNLLRIYYFVSQDDTGVKNLILLNAIVKPDGSKSSSRYDGISGKRVRKAIKESIQLAIEFKRLYPSSPENYEPFNF